MAKISYKKLDHILLDRDIGKVELANLAKIGTATLSKMSKGQAVSLTTLVKILDVLGGGLDFGDLVAYVPDAPSADAGSAGQ